MGDPWKSVGDRGRRPLVAGSVERHERLAGRELTRRRAARGERARPRTAANRGGHQAWPVEVARAALDAGLTRPRREPHPGGGAEGRGRCRRRSGTSSAGCSRTRRAARCAASRSSTRSTRSSCCDASASLRLEEARTPALLLQVNVSGEESKAGLAPEPSWRGARSLATAGVIGLMTMAPMGASFEEARRAFARLRELRDRLEQRPASVCRSSRWA